MEYTREDWEQQGSLIVAFGKDGAVICKMAEPQPKSGMVEFEPLEIGSAGWELQMNNARLIATAVNACIKINPDNPQAVAESIGDMDETLRGISSHITDYFRESPCNETLSYIRSKCEQALAKAEGK